VLFCHGSPRRDDEVLTRQTPDAALRDALRDVRERVVVGGHTHQQMVRRLDGAPTFINAGSVGIPYEGRPGAFWLIIDGGRPTMRETSYPIEPALEELRASGFPDVESLIRESLLEPIDPRAVAEYFEHLAGRGPAPELNADGPPGG
jgi:diadenosine tetraphosphatase ApaH/serine/threonine PP2A family protein phosphatase